MKIIDYPLLPKVVKREINEIKTVIVKNELEIKALRNEIDKAEFWAVDTETHDEILLKNGLWGAVRVISIATKSKGIYRKYVIDVNDFSKNVLENYLNGVEKAPFGWNANFDQEVLEILGIKIKHWRDVMLDESLLFSGINGRNFHLSLEIAARRYLGYEISGKGSVQTSFDKSSVITYEQYEYAANDSLITLYLGEIISDMLEEHGLVIASDLEQSTREFIYMMETTAGGFPFKMNEWGEYLVDEVKKAEEALKEIAKFTNETGDEPSWNVDSDIQLKDKFNEFDRENVEKYLGREFKDTDSIDKATLIELQTVGSKLAELVLTYRKPAKLSQTFGTESLSKFYFDGRIRSRYMQCRTSTGRLSSHSPNGQNLPGLMKAFMKPEEGRAMISADYSQAELRVLGYLSNEESWLNAFKVGIDLHDMTAKNMFNIDMEELKKSDPKQAKAMRTRVKATNFGMPYNMGASLLARTLSNTGVPTNVVEAKSIIDKYYKANPKVSEYLKQRDKFVEDFSKNFGEVDWDLSFKLLNLFVKYDAKRRAFKKKNRRYPTSRELIEYTNEVLSSKSLFDNIDSEVITEDMVNDVTWAFKYDAPVVLRPNGDPLAFESRTISGRRRIFTIPMDNGFERTEGNNGGSGADTSDKFSGVVTVAMLIAATTNKAEAANVRDEWAREHNVKLPSGINRFDRSKGNSKEAYRKFFIDERKQCVKAFENKKDLKIKYVQDICLIMGDKAKKYLLDAALTESINKMIGAFRNHPIQGSVADIAELAFKKLNLLSDKYEDLIWVQTVHDSISGECRIENAPELAKLQKEMMEKAMEELLPGIPAKVDAEYGLSLDDSDIIEKIK